MKFTLSWLKEHLDTDASLEEIVERLTMIGLEVEEVTNRADRLKPFKIAKVLEAEQHPNADRLRVLKVDTGQGEPVQIVCGAPNARAGLVGVLGKPGDHIPGLDITLSVGKIRDVESFGMMCSERELELSDEHDGIIDLPEDAPVGVNFAKWAGLDEPVIEIGLTPNRPDCTGVYGIARDLAAAGLGKLKERSHEQIRGNYPCPVSVSLDFGDTRPMCKAFGLRMVKGIKNGPSPKWLQDRLTAIGLRPINILVDITNYLTFDQGRPLHVFDADKVHGNLVVRRGRAGEGIDGLNGKSYELDDTVCVIADDNGIESLGGILGGEPSGCTEDTVNVLIESALWEEDDIAATGRKLGVNTDARYRFERGVDPDYMMPGLEYATRLVLDLCGGEPSETTQAGRVPDSSNIIDFPYSEIRRLSGVEVSQAEANLTLKSLGFWISGSGDTVKVAAPSWRPDIEGKADLVEEVVRILGLDRVPLTPLPRTGTVGQKVLTTGQIRRNRTRRALATRGFNEAVTWSFISKPQAELFGGGNAALELANPISPEMSDMRPSLLPGLLSAAQRNADRGFGDVALFEVGQVFQDDTPEGQKMVAAGVRRGTAKLQGASRHWSGSSTGVDVYDAKADAEAALAAIGAPVEKLQVHTDAPGTFHPGRSGCLKLGPKNALAVFGEIHPRTLADLDLEGPLVAFEIYLDALPQPKTKGGRSKGALNASHLMPVRRDFAFLVGKDVKAEVLLKAARGAEKTLIADVTLFDIYVGQGVPDDQKSVAIDVLLQPRQKTLTDEEIDAVAKKIIANVEKATGGTLRG
ncbi:MAG: phenylalanine--tRNA ligase subunit beta [Roseibium album]|uniref:phenylalanine--tRNA ligase subunit beta n=1 Tax=Roseibium album TaxID=311410 RepID=UPI0018CB76C0|nr:phenylalanyl-tRNA synthetase beta chain [Labrenzia sp. EL_162]MBG6161928.1 phenylalanyl-tRNA synthetase beta chain [Labrenzia sp. EL_195]MBG6176316.1 phenylalanyl-tRNA synthetase beta chain [Labrenzia sp. EL_132]MBG6193221.1 phenylalanyl-tRNA synthetase beta chain [Labrenzia sp. EL_159]MBG6231216.1 phenylalanyl-tRNA synthetase beta chain [Labrenzia sp. EL_208]